MKAGRLSIFALVAAVCMLCVSAWGQATTSLHGTVTDVSGATIPGATVTLTETATGASRDTTTNSTVAYSFPAVLPGNYVMRVTASGFQTYVQQGLQLLVSLPASNNVQMQIDSVEQTVEVNERTPRFNTTDASLGHTMGADTIQALPCDWAKFFHDRIYRIDPKADLDGIERGGYKLVFTDTPSPSERLLSSAFSRYLGSVDCWYSIGPRVGPSGRIADVLWNGPADKAGISPTEKIVAVNGQIDNSPCSLAWIYPRRPLCGHFTC